MTYPEALKYLAGFINYEKIPAYPYKESLKLERIKGFLAAIDNPQDNLKCLHIAGSKGKGSACAFLTYILRQAGFKVGLYTSPHLSDFRERIRILNPKSEIRNPKSETNPKSKIQKLRDFEGMISKKALAGLVTRLKPEIERYNKISRYGPLSFFEVYTALAFLYFKEQRVDFAVLETGLGGRLDATNVVNALVCAITPISYEHTQKLGKTLAEIAKEKAGIIKVNPLARYPVNPLNRQTGKQANRQTLIVISAPQEKEAIQVIRKKCKEAGARLIEVKRPKPTLKINLIGRHQLMNATVAVRTIEALRAYGIKVGINAIRQGLYNASWPGRCEVIAKRPKVVLDGAQNIASAQALVRAIRENFRYKKLNLIFGVSKDKDIKGLSDTLGGVADRVILTKANNPRAAEPQRLAGYFNGKPPHQKFWWWGKKEVYLSSSVREAKTLAYRLAGDEDLILVTGSLFVVGEFRDAKV